MDVATLAETPANDEPRVDAVETAPETTTEAPKASVEDDLAAVWDKMHTPERQRDERGRFAKADGEDEGDAGEPGEAPGETAEAAPEQRRYDDPVEAVRAKWDRLDTHARQLISTQQQELNRAVQTVQAYEPVGSVLLAHSDYLQAVAQQDVPGYLDRVLTYSRQLDMDPAGTIRQLAQLYNVDLQQISDPFAEGYVDPTTAALKQELVQLKQQVGQFEQYRSQSEYQRAQQESAQLLSLTESFFAANPNAEQLADEIELQVRALKVKTPNIDPQTALKQAYERAQWVSDDARQAKLKAQAEAAEKARAEAARKQAEQARRAKGINVNGATAANRRPVSVEETMSSVWDRLHS